MDYKVADIGLADLGRKLISTEEPEMPGLMQTRAKYGPDRPLAGARFLYCRQALSVPPPEKNLWKMALVLFPVPYYNMLIDFCPKSVSFAERSLHYDQHHQRQRKHPYYR